MQQDSIEFLNHLLRAIISELEAVQRNEISINFLLYLHFLTFFFAIIMRSSISLNANYSIMHLFLTFASMLFFAG